MACLNPIKLKTNSSVIGSVYSQKLYNYVGCGECCDCQRQKSQEWLFRSSWQFEEVKKYGGFALFDTLTYSNEYLPHISRFLGPTDCDFPCFSLPDVQDFLNRLRVKFRRYLNLPKYSVLPLKYFLTSEYGTDDRYTHRPHYHIILYVLGQNLITPLDLSYMISSCWLYGRTDGAKYKGKNYVLRERTIYSHSKNCDSAYLHQYVAKYVEKDSEFSKVVKSRLYAYMYYVYSNSISSRVVGRDFDNWIYEDSLPYLPCAKVDNDLDFIDWLSLPSSHSLFLRTKHLLEQFHKQSQGFGSYLLDNLDLPYLWKTGCQKYRIPAKNIYIDVPLSMYYYRKLFQQQVYLGDKLVWQYTEVGKHFADVQKFRKSQYLADDIANTFKQFNYNPIVDYTKLANYSVFRENCIGYIPATCSVDDKLRLPHWFLYKRHGLSYISDCFHSDDDEYIDSCIAFERFVQLNMIKDEYFDSLLAKYREFKLNMTKGKQELFDKLQKRKKSIKQLSIF